MRVGSLFSGYGGLDMAVGGDLAWYAEVEPAAIKVMEAHHPGVPNLGDVTQVDWSQVDPVDVITGGYPCQPFSNAGKRKGKDDERHLWPYVRDAISAIRPNRAVLENVRGHLTLGFADVLADLAALGLSARWGIVRAAEAGAPHNRARLFIVTNTNSASSETHDNGRPWNGESRRPQPLECGWSLTSNASSERHGSRQGPTSLGQVDRAHEGSAWEWQRSRQKFGTGSLEDVADTSVIGRTPQWAEPTGQQRQVEPDCDSSARWGQYAPAIDRWERLIGRSAPAPTIQRAGRDRLNPVFVEWMMGLPEGWVTGHGLSASQELKMLGNGVVPQQAALALRLLGAA
jgi:DNA (cytosine-5)-methyltransferase 1